MLSADLLLKGLAGVAAVGGATTVGVCYQQEKWIFAKKKVEKLSDLAGKVGLDCTGTTGQTDETGKDCTIKTDGLSVKQGTNKDTAKKKGNATAGTTEGKIKGYKVGNGFKFVIEDGDIALTGGITNSPVSKLEQFETYEIEEEKGNKKQYLTRKNDARKEIKLALGLPEETDCDLPDSTTATKTCNLDANKIKKINFDGRKGEPTIVDGDAATTLSSTLKISKTSEAPFNGGGYKFELQSNKEITLDSKANKSIKKDTNTEFKIKVTPAAGGPKLTLEKAWNVTELAKKVGLVCPAGEKKECTLGTSININNGTASDTTKKLTGLTKKENTDDKKVKYEENVGDHNQGFKFFVEEATDIELQGGSNGTENDKKILKKNGTSGSEISYEILKDSTNNNTWYLTKKTTTSTAT